MSKNMKIDDKLITYLEELSNLHLSDDEKNHFVSDMQEVIEEMSALENLNPETLDTDNIAAPLPDYYNAFREDTPVASFEKDLILLNAPKHNGEMFIAPKGR